MVPWILQQWSDKIGTAVLKQQIQIRAILRRPQARDVHEAKGAVGNLLHFRDSSKLS